MIDEARAALFWKKVFRGESCWIWIGKKSKDGYGRCTVEGRQIQAHRLSWLIAHGSLPEARRGKDGGLYVCHTCDNPCCVNPEHLFLGEQQRNMRDATAKGRVFVPTPDNKTKLTEAQVSEIRRIMSAGRRDGPRLAKAYGVSVTTVEGIVRRLSWRHV